MAHTLSSASSTHQVGVEPLPGTRDRPGPRGGWEQPEWTEAGRLVRSHPSTPSCLSPVLRGWCPCGSVVSATGRELRCRARQGTHPSDTEWLKIWRGSALPISGASPPTPTLQLWQTGATWGHLPAVANASDFPEKLTMGFLPEIVCFFGVGN